MCKYFFNQEASSSWERIIYVQAIAILGSPRSLPVLASFIYGDHPAETNVRIVALYGLTRRHMPSSVREPVSKSYYCILFRVSVCEPKRRNSFKYEIKKILKLKYVRVYLNCFHLCQLLNDLITSQKYICNNAISAYFQCHSYFIVTL